MFAGHSLLEHACVPNAFSLAWQVPGARGRDRLEHVLVAARDIARGEHVAISYISDDFVGTSQRRLTLAWWGFLCRCALCSDPAELGLHLEAWHCGHCNRE